MPSPLRQTEISFRRNFEVRKENERRIIVELERVEPELRSPEQEMAISSAYSRLSALNLAEYELDEAIKLATSSEAYKRKQITEKLAMLKAPYQEWSDASFRAVVADTLTFILEEML